MVDTGREAALPPDAVLLLGVGDTHGDFAPLFAAAGREPAARALLQVGDLTAGKAGREQCPDDDPATLASLPLPLVWVHGNHEHWDLLGFDLETGERRPAGETVPAHHLWPGEAYTVPGTEIQVVGLPGNFAPTWYERPKPFPGDRVRHFNAADVAALQPFHRPAVLLLHEAFRGQVQGRIGSMGVPVLASLVRQLAPAVCLTGHHHAFATAEHGRTLAVALPRGQEGYLRLWLTPAGERIAWELVRLSP
jgi:Icc-related predicted phosphoesterase